MRQKVGGKLKTENVTSSRKHFASHDTAIQFDGLGGWPFSTRVHIPRPEPEPIVCLRDAETFTASPKQRKPSKP